MSKLTHALELAAEGFHVFPLEPGSKLPHIDGYPTRATRDPEQIRRWWTCPVLGIEADFNIGISTSRFGDDAALLVVDVDNKGGKHGDEALFALELDGYEFPVTRTQSTPTGGRHLVYRVERAVKQGAGVLGNGLDTRSRGGYIVGAGSEVEAGVYASDQAPVAPALGWLVDRCGQAPERPAASAVAAPVDQDRAHFRAVQYLQNEAPLAVEGQGGDQTAYAVACRLKDFGLGSVAALALMLEHWNARCSPPWSPDELERKVGNAYRYGTEPPGVAAPEVQFAPAAPTPAREDPGHPVEGLNKEFAFVIAGGGSHILWETTDEHGRYRLEHLAETAFHKKFASKRLQIGKKSSPITELWMESPTRRSYDGLCFMPGLEAPPRFYNLWRGFAVQPAEKYAGHPSVEAFLDHARENVCGGDANLFRWLIGYFAHLVQKPGEKPLVALVFKGGKGVGKNALVERVGSLLGHHFLVTSNRRYLVGNFNGHLENCLLFALDEAFWSGDKQVEGILKDIITGKNHVIEHKGKEPYSVDNRTRVVIIGNEDWLVPASHDERRFAVFSVGDGRKQDRAFFQAMREGMEAGGYRELLRYLLDFDITGLDLNQAPQTDALLEQKHASLGPVEQWWHECLVDGKIVGGDFDVDWPAQVSTDRFRAAFRRYIKDREIRSRMPDATSFGIHLARCAPGILKRRVRANERRDQVYELPDLARARDGWDRFIGHESRWEK